MRLLAALLRKNIYNFSSSTQSSVLEQLNSRSLIRVAGCDAANLLQGLITNDMQHLSQNAGSMFAMFLNNKGRVLYDTIIYRLPAENIYMLEVDKEVVDAVRKHLIIYRLRKKVDVVSVEDQFKIWVHFNPSVTITSTRSKDTQTINGRIVPCTALDETTPDNSRVVIKRIGDNEILTFRDPRLSLLGSRVLVPVTCEAELDKIFTGAKDTRYKQLRYQLGVGEGIDELPPGNCFPLEANCDYLHGVSFHKGCYIGQELTARTHHTGVVRKRLMPLLLESPFKKVPAKDEAIKSGETNIGKLRGFEQDTGLGLLRIQQALDAKEIIVNDTTAKTFKPNWWPLEAAKEKLSKGKV